jgi:hypothetical protein
MWKGVDPDQSIYYSTYKPNTGWAQQAQLKPDNSLVPLTDNPPALASSGDGYLYELWKGPGNQYMYWTRYSEATGWAQQRQFICANTTPLTDSGPSLAAFNKTLFALWMGANGDHSMYFSTLASLDSGWTNQIMVPKPIATSTGPALSVYNGLLYAAWKDNANQSIWYTSYDPNLANFGFISVGGPIQIQLPTAIATDSWPMIAAFGPLLYFVWKSSGGSAICWATADTTGAG